MPLSVTVMCRSDSTIYEIPDGSPTLHPARVTAQKKHQDVAFVTEKRVDGGMRPQLGALAGLRNGLASWGVSGRLSVTWLKLFT
eukprot:gene16981-biopygen4821